MGVLPQPRSPRNTVGKMLHYRARLARFGAFEQ